MDPKVREKQITRTSIIGIIANIFLVIFKAAVGLLSGSIAIVLDAVNNLTDVMSSLITIVGIKLARRKPDDDHPFGHGRIEYFSAIIIAGIVMTAGITAFIESVKKIFHPEVATYTVVMLIIIAVGVIVKFLLGRYVTSQGRKYNSEALVASGQDASFDSIISASTLVSAVITIATGISIDGILGAVISVFIIKAGIEMLMESVNSIIGTLPNSEVSTAIKKTVAGVDGVMGAYDLILHNYGPDSAIASVHVEVAGELSAYEIHQITKAIQLEVMEKHHMFITVGIYAVDQAHAKRRQEISKLARSHEGVHSTHGVFIDDDRKYVSFDAVIDFSVDDRDALAQALKDEIQQQLLPGYTVEVSFDLKYS